MHHALRRVQWSLMDHDSSDGSVAWTRPQGKYDEVESLYGQAKSLMETKNITSSSKYTAVVVSLGRLLERQVGSIGYQLMLTSFGLLMIHPHGVWSAPKGPKPRRHGSIRSTYTLSAVSRERWCKRKRREVNCEPSILRPGVRSIQGCKSHQNGHSTGLSLAWSTLWI